MGKLTDMEIRAWIKAGERFEGRADGDGLYLRYREGDTVPVWRVRYRFAGKARIILCICYTLVYHLIGKDVPSWPPQRFASMGIPLP